jgi:hypothetical protein
MGNVLNVSGEELEQILKQANLKKEDIETLMANEGFKYIMNNIETMREVAMDIPREARNEEPVTYEGSCGFTVQDPEGQRILDKYLPRSLNSHATEMLNLFSKTTFKQLRESPDRYPESAFWSDPLNSIFLAHDKDFQEFSNKETIQIDLLVANSHHNKQIFREVLNYIVNLKD